MKHSRSTANGGFKSFLKTTKRSEIVKSLTAINDILLDFIVNFTKMIVSGRPFEWPLIQLTNSERNVYIFQPEYKLKQIAEDKKDENRTKQMRRRWPNVEFSSTELDCQ